MADENVNVQDTPTPETEGATGAPQEPQVDIEALKAELAQFREGKHPFYQELAKAWQTELESFLRGIQVGPGVTVWDVVQAKLTGKTQYQPQGITNPLDEIRQKLSTLEQSLQTMMLERQTQELAAKLEAEFEEAIKGTPASNGPLRDVVERIVVARGMEDAEAGRQVNIAAYVREALQALEDYAKAKVEAIKPPQKPGPQVPKSQNIPGPDILKRARDEAEAIIAEMELLSRT